MNLHINNSILLNDSSYSKSRNLCTLYLMAFLVNLGTYFAFGQRLAAGGQIFVSGWSSHGCGIALQT